MGTLRSIAYQMYWGLPLAGWLGIATYICLIASALVMVLMRKRIGNFNVKTHKRLGILTIILASVHFLLAISIYI